MVAAESSRDEAPKSKKAKNKISPSTSSKYAHLMTVSEDEDEPDEQINEEYINGLYEAHLQYLREIKRKKRSMPAFVAHEIPEPPEEAIVLFSDFDAKTPNQKMQEFLMLKDVQSEYIEDLERGDSTKSSQRKWGNPPPKPSRFLIDFLPREPS